MIDEREFFKRCDTPPPARWEWSDYNDDGISHIFMRDCYFVGCKFLQKLLVDGAQTDLHIVVASNRGVEITDWKMNEDGGLVAEVWRNDYRTHTRQLHLSFDKQDTHSKQRYMTKLRALKKGARLHIVGDVPFLDFGSEEKNNMYNFRGFEFELQCMLLYVNCITIEKTPWQRFVTFDFF